MIFFGKNSGAIGEGRQYQKVDQGLLRYAAEYTEELELPEPSGKLAVRLLGEGTGELCRRRKFSVKAPCYFLVYGEGGREDLNAGYLLGQLAVLMRFGGVGARILKQCPAEYERDGAKRVCCGVLAVGTGLDPERAGGRAEHPFICREAGEAWNSRVLDYAKELLPQELQAGVRLVPEGRAIHLAAGRYFGRSAGASRFHAGVTLAAVMASAQELWIDLAMVKLPQELGDRAAGPDYLISVCRREEKETFPASLCLEGGAVQPRERKDRADWRYA